MLGRLCLRKSLQPRRQVEASKGQKPSELHLFRHHWEVELSSWFDRMKNSTYDEDVDDYIIKFMNRLDISAPSLSGLQGTMSLSRTSKDPGN